MSAPLRLATCKPSPRRAPEGRPGGRQIAVRPQPDFARRRHCRLRSGASGDGAHGGAL
jgi:hypothetical protein